MLEHHEERALAEIEAHLHDDDPGLSFAMDAVVPPLRIHPLVRSALVLLVAIVLTAASTLLVGPDLGGFVAVVTLSAAAMYAWNAFRVCRGLRDTPR